MYRTYSAYHSIDGDALKIIHNQLNNAVQTDLA
jgi:hypothetical protein